MELQKIDNPTRILNSVEIAFTELVVSKTFTEIPKDDRAEMVFHWKILKKFLKSLEVPEPVTETEVTV
jgi:hypothetical protein